MTRGPVIEGVKSTVYTVARDDDTSENKHKKKRGREGGGGVQHTCTHTT